MLRQVLRPRAARHPGPGAAPARARAARCTLVALAALLWVAVPASAKKIYKYTDAEGITHYTDRQPAVDAEVTAIPVRVDTQQIAQLRLDGSSRQRQAVVYNPLAGPVQVELSFRESTNILADPPLPLRTVVPARGEQRIATFRAGNARQAASFELRMSAVPGDPAARHADASYAVPVPRDSRWRIDQGFDGEFSHTGEQSRYAIDINVPEGTPVLAARAGVVMQVEDDFDGAGLDMEKYASRANHVRVLHPDGSMAVYAHLQPESVRVAAGRQVSVGQELGASGNTGYSTGPHLHFAVQVNAGMQLRSIPFRMHDDSGPVRIPGAN